MAFTHQFRYECPVVPIDDTKEAKDSSQDEDNKSHCKLGSLIRLLDVKGWSNCIYDLVANRCTQDPNQFYTNPYGLYFAEVTASKIIKLDFNGNFIQHGSTDYGYNLPGFYLQSAIFKARPDVNTIIVLHNALVSGISATKPGFLPVTVEGLATADVSYLDHNEDCCHDMAKMADIAVKALGPKNHFLCMRNHGLVTVASSPQEAFFYLELYLRAAQAQLIASAMVKNMDDLVVLPITETWLNRDFLNDIYNKINAHASDSIIWQPGELEYEGAMRKLDLMGFKTSYPYKKRVKMVEQ